MSNRKSLRLFLTTLNALAGGFFEISRIRDEENRAASNA
jgi:hypothetical protein